MNDFYYHSEECERDDLPVGCRVIRYLNVEGMKNKAAVIETEHPIYKAQASSYVVLAKGLSSVSEVFTGQLIGVYLLPLDVRAGAVELDLSAGLRPVQDWGALTRSRDEAEKLQLRPDGGA